MISRPIETAPRDGAPVRVTSGRLWLYSHRAYFKDGAWRIWSPDDHLHGTTFEPQPTQWMPLDDLAEA